MGADRHRIRRTVDASIIFWNESVQSRTAKLQNRATPAARIPADRRGDGALRIRKKIAISLGSFTGSSRSGDGARQRFKKKQFASGGGGGTPPDPQGSHPPSSAKIPPRIISGSGKPEKNSSPTRAHAHARDTHTIRARAKNKSTTGYIISPVALLLFIVRDPLVI